MIFIFEDIGKLVGAFVNWGFMMALLFNLVSFSDSRSRDRSPLRVAIVICVSYLSTVPLPYGFYLYPLYVFADILTIAMILIVQYRRAKIPAMYYCIFFLFLNGVLHTAIFIDLDIVGTDDSWWLWSVYSIGINFNDAMMIIVLIVNRDFLGLCKVLRCCSHKRYSKLETLKG